MGTIAQQSVDWKKVFGAILACAFEAYEIDYKEFPKKYGYNEATIRYWKRGRSFPRWDAMHNLKEYNTKVMTDYIGNSFDLDAVIGGIFEDIGVEEQYRIIRNNCTLVSELVNKSLMYCVYRGKNIAKERNLKSPNPTNRTRAVVFDFDGTLASGEVSKTTWESLWVKLGYPIEECQELHMRFNRQEISHAEWCEITERSF